MDKKCNNSTDMSHLAEGFEIEKTRIKRTRKNRINLSERLKKYSHKWNMIIFLLNMEAVILIITVISSEKVEFLTVPSGIFSAYVILLQHFINEQKYSERSLKAHYHQLEIGEFIDDINRLIAKVKDEEDFHLKEIRNEEKNILMRYQLSLKSIENHSKADDINNILSDNKVRNPLTDLSSDNIFAYVNLIIALIVLTFIIFLLGQYIIG